MNDGFVWLGDLLNNWPGRLARPKLEVGCQLRLADAVERLPESGRVGEADLAVLVRQVLRRQAEIGGGDPWLQVPQGSPWPSGARWRAHGVVAMATGSGGHGLRAQRWKPAWLMADGDTAPSQAAEGDIRRRISDTKALGDGFLREAIGEAMYTSTGQQQAVRTVLASADGATIVVNLPTGTGKSAVFIVPAFLWSESGGVTVVVVPTTALALDQERGIRASLARGAGAGQLPAHLAFHAGLTEEERSTIYRAIRNGTQALVLTSPESLTTSLAPALYAATRAGHLRALAVDEAHLVAQWGAGFRSDFQAAAGLRTDLLKAARDTGQPGFRTILLSGTLTEEALETLLGLYGRPGPVEVVSSVSLRPEPSYWLKRCVDEVERERMVLEAIRHLPRPLLLYTTRVDHARYWTARLRRDGYRRLGVVTGDSTADDRRRVIEGLTGRDLVSGRQVGTDVDVVVATSAFGLGIDQPDIRSVIHACVPETVDRYYQEVGRGGRDGLACISLLLYTEEDLETARSLNRRRIISVDRGFDRWLAMRTDATMLGDSLMRVSLKARPSDLLWDSEHNEDWNLRTLTLMSRAGMIELQSEPPPLRVEDHEPADASRQGSSYVVVRLLHGHLADRKAWETQLKEARRRTHRADAESLELMHKALSGTVDLADVFQDAYAIDLPEREPFPRITVLPQRSCGGCRDCRAHARAPYQGVSPQPEPVHHPRTTEDAVLLDLFVGGTTSVAIVTFQQEDYASESAWLDLCDRMTLSLSRHGVRNIVAPSVILNRHQIQELHRRVPDRFMFLFDRYTPHEVPCLPSLIIHPRLPVDSILPLSYLTDSPDFPRRVLLIPASTRDPERPAYPVALLRRPSLQADSVLARL